MLVRPAPSSHMLAVSPSDHPRRSRSDSSGNQPRISHSDSNESRRLPPREERFLLQYGSRLHSYNRDKAPYPASYNRDDLELVLLDHELIRATKQGSGTFINFEGNHPKRCLDVGCGMGAWTIAAARDWPECTFVGYDLMNVQIPLWALDDDIASRIEWVHGNLLRQRLPFEDDEFDYVHITGLAFGVPENKWMYVYEEIRRVMKTGGMIEQLEEDALFPVLPRWFTEPLHAHFRGPNAYFPGSGSPDFPPPEPHPECRHDESLEEPHEHAFLESLFHDVFENRFINPVPSSCLPGYFSAIFGQVITPPILQFPMPPLPPLTPLSAELEGLQLQPSPTSASEFAHEQPTTLGSHDFLPSTADTATDVSHPLSTTRTPTLDSTASTDLTTSSARSSLSSYAPSMSSTDSLHRAQAPSPSPQFNTQPTMTATSDPKRRESHAISQPVPMSPSSSVSVESERSTPRGYCSHPSLRSPPGGGSSSSASRRDSSAPKPSRRSGSGSGPSGPSSERASVPAGDLRTEDSTSLGGARALLFPMETILALPERSLNMHLHRALGLVLSVKEAMWEELCTRAACGRGQARADPGEAALRERFEEWVERYRSDVRALVALWHCMMLSGWQHPRRDPVSKAEVLEELRLRHEILDARRHAKEEDLGGFSRSIRLMVGTKVPMDSVA